MKVFRIAASATRYDVPALVKEEGDELFWPQVGECFEKDDIVYIIVRDSEDVTQASVYARGKVTGFVPLSEFSTRPEWGDVIDPDYFTEAYFDMNDKNNQVARIEIDKIGTLTNFAVDENDDFDGSVKKVFRGLVRNKKHPNPVCKYYPVTIKASDEETEMLEKLVNTTTSDIAAAFRKQFGN